MHFQPDGALDDSLPGVAAEAMVWNALRQALESDAGYLLHQFSVYDAQGNLRAKPDILLIHFELGFWIFECKGCSLHNIEAINGGEWRMREWHKEVETPLAQADNQMFQIKNGLQQNLETRSLQARLTWQYRLALPRIRRQEWQERFGDPPFIGALLFADDLDNPKQLRQTLYSVDRAAQTPLSETEWDLILKTLGLNLGDPSDGQVFYDYDPQAVIRRVQERILKLDEEQRKIANQYPEGPQRIRGLAGTGKTVVLTRRAAKIYAEHPDWDIAVVFFTQSLYEQIRRQISEVCQSKFDEAQGIGSLTVPGTAELFGRDEAGKPKVKLGGRAVVLRNCYRTPKVILMAAHAINMGLLRQGQPLQGVTQKEQWENLGYEVVEGDFRKPGSPVVLTYKSSHAVDQETFEPKVDPQSLLIWRTFPSEEEEQNWVAQQIEQDIRCWHFEPEDLLVTSLASFKTGKNYWKALQTKLKQKGIHAIIAGEDTEPDIFRMPKHVTLSGIFRAKGNEAWKVYVCQFQNTTEPGLSVEQQLIRRNQAFVALTRAKLWCVVTGVCPKNHLAPAFQELQQAKEQYPYLRFPAFNQGSLRRVHDVDQESESS